MNALIMVYQLLHYSVSCYFCYLLFYLFLALIYCVSPTSLTAEFLKTYLVLIHVHYFYCSMTLLLLISVWLIPLALLHLPSHAIFFGKIFATTLYKIEMSFHLSLSVFYVTHNIYKYKAFFWSFPTTLIKMSDLRKQEPCFIMDKLSQNWSVT